MEILLPAKDFFFKIQNDLTFALILLVCFICSLILKRYSSAIKSTLGTSRAMDGLIGCVLVIFTTRAMFFCSFFVVIFHLALYKVVKNPVLLANVSFYGTFLYLAVLRIMNFAGLLPLVHIANGIQLLMTLRVIGLSYEISDLRILNQSAKQNNKLKIAIVKDLTAFESFTYLYGFVGLFTGPYYTYQTFFDSNIYVISKTECIKKLVIEKISKLFWSLPLLIAFSWLDPIDALRGDKINDYNILSLFIWSALAFIYFRMRIYTAWMISESVCIIAGIGVYPSDMNSKPGRGPNKIKSFGFQNDLINQTDGRSEDCIFNAETISNLDIPQIEYSDGFRSGMRAWNRTVQFWLANFVYKRTNKSFRMPYTMLVSAFWHGIHPGYFLSFLTIPLCTTAEDLLFKIFPPENRSYWLSITWSFIRMRGFESMACGFLLLTWSDTIRLWTNLYLWLHCTMILTIVGCKIYLFFHKNKFNNMSDDINCASVKKE